MIRTHKQNFAETSCDTLPLVAALGWIETDAMGWGHVDRGEGANAATPKFSEFLVSAGMKTLS